MQQSDASVNRNVLVVDDQAENRLLLRRVLTRLNYRVEAAADGEQAWRKLLQRNFGFVVTDYEMPRLDGLGLINRIRRCPWDGVRRRPVILHSALNNDVKLRHAVRADQRTYFFPKPLDVRRLTKLLKYMSSPNREASTGQRGWLMRIALPINDKQNLMPDA